MMKIGRWEGNEIIYTVDVVDNSVNLIEDFDFAFDILGANMVIDGMVVSEATVPDMTIKISAGTAKDSAVGTFLVGEALVGTVTASDPVNDRIDIVEVKRFIEDVTPATRQFRDPITEAISDATIDTKTEYSTEIQVTAGTAAPSPVAPSTTAGWIKIAEILVSGASTTVIDANIYNVDAKKEGNVNTNWTTDITTIFRNGSISDMSTRITDNTTEGIPEWINSPNQRYYATASYVSRNGNVYQARIGDDGANINSQKDPETNPLWWILIWETPVVPAYDDTENTLYNTKGYIVERYGTHYSSSGKSPNVGKDPEDPQNEDYWITSPGWTTLKRWSNQADPLPGGMHPTTDFSDALYQQNIKVDTIKRGAKTYDVYQVCLDSTQITGDATLEDDILAVGTAKEYLRIDKYFPENVGIKDCIDMRGRSTRAITDGGGVAPTLAEVQEDTMQKITGGLTFTPNTPMQSTNIGSGAITVKPNVSSLGYGASSSATRKAGWDFDNSLSTFPNTAKTNDVETHVKALVRGVDYIIVIIAQ